MNEEVKDSDKPYVQFQPQNMNMDIKIIEEVKCSEEEKTGDSIG